jgi:hypothetical protein
VQVNQTRRYFRPRRCSCFRPGLPSSRASCAWCLATSRKEVIRKDRAKRGKRHSQPGRIGNKLGTGLAMLARCDCSIHRSRRYRNRLEIRSLDHHRNVFSNTMSMADVPASKSGPRNSARNDDVARPASPSTTTLLALGVTARRRRHRRMFPGEPEGATDSAGNAVIPARNGSVDEMGTSHRHVRASQCDRRKLPKSPAAVKNAMRVLPLRGPQARAPSTRGGR